MNQMFHSSIQTIPCTAHERLNHELNTWVFHCKHYFLSGCLHLSFKLTGRYFKWPGTTVVSIFKMALQFSPWAQSMLLCTGVPQPYPRGFSCKVWKLSALNSGWQWHKLGNILNIQITIHFCSFELYPELKSISFAHLPGNSPLSVIKQMNSLFLKDILLPNGSLLGTYSVL